MKIGILQAGRTPEDLRQIHGDYDEMHKRLLVGRSFVFDTYPVLDNVFPSDPHQAEGWLITGSRFGVYEGHDWIAPLEQFLRTVFDAGVPMIGVCFGHQILAQALGGKVEKFTKGWSVGAVQYDAINEGMPHTIMAWHQDQITRLPQSAKVITSSDFCQYAMLSYGDRALSVQPHPEFTPEFMRDLIAARANILPPDITQKALDSLDVKLTSQNMADQFEAFFKKNRL